MSAPRRLAALATLTALLIALVAIERTPAQTPSASAFEGYIELLRQQASIPSLAGVLIQDRAIAWERGLGFANLESKIAARSDTPYAVGDLTQIITSTLLLQCAEQRRINLSDPVRLYGVNVPESNATIRQMLSHTSQGGAFKYDPERFALLTPVVEECARQPFRKTIALQIIDRMGMAGSVPGRDATRPGAVPSDMLDRVYIEHYGRILDNLAVPYKVQRGHATRTELSSEGINAATGLVSTAHDLAQFDLALDSGTLLRDDTLEAAWTPALTGSGTQAPMGLGWFVQSYRGTTIVWQYGLVSNAYSALIVKVPARRATMILLANSEGLATPFQLEAGDITRSPFALVLLRMLL